MHCLRRHQILGFEYIRRNKKTNKHDLNRAGVKLEAQWAEPVSLSVHLAKQFQRRRILEINQPETRIAYGSHVCYGRHKPFLFLIG
jgi:hypothetical protein